MKVVRLQEANLEECVRQAPEECVLLTRLGSPVALLLGVQGLDLEQVELGQSEKFWKLIRERRGQPTLSRAELEGRLAER